MKLVKNNNLKKSRYVIMIYYNKSVIPLDKKLKKNNFVVNLATYYQYLNVSLVFHLNSGFIELWEYMWGGQFF